MAFRLHHVGLLVASIEEAARIHSQRYGYLVESEVILDPVQTARVLFLRLPGGGNWLELVSPANDSSKLSNALKKRGEGLHHLCYEVDDIESACTSLREQAQLMLAPPTPATAFLGRRIAWFMDRRGHLTELLEAGDGPFNLASICSHSTQESSG